MKIEKINEYITNTEFDLVYNDVRWAYDMADTLSNELKIKNSHSEKIELAKLMLTQLNFYMTEAKSEGEPNDE